MALYINGEKQTSGAGVKQTFFFYQDNVAASQTAAALTCLGDAVRTGYAAPYAGSVIGIVIVSNEARTASTCTVDATVGGTATGLQAVLDGTNTTTDATTQAQDADTFAAKALIGVKVTTTGTWTPETADILVGVTVEY